MQTHTHTHTIPTGTEIGIVLTYRSSLGRGQSHNWIELNWMWFPILMKYPTIDLDV